MTEYFSKFVSSCVGLRHCVTLTHRGAFYSHPPLLQTIDGIVRKTRSAETDAMVRKKLVESTGDDPHVSAALELFIRNVIEENNRRIIGHCRSCYHGYTALDQSEDGRCQSCFTLGRNRSR